MCVGQQSIRIHREFTTLLVGGYGGLMGGQGCGFVCSYALPTPDISHFAFEMRAHLKCTFEMRAHFDERIVNRL